MTLTASLHAFAEDDRADLGAGTDAVGQCCFFGHVLGLAATTEADAAAVRAAQADGGCALAMRNGYQILTTLILTAPPMAAFFFQGTLGSFMAYSQIGGSPAAQPARRDNRRALMCRSRRRIQGVMSRRLQAIRSRQWLGAWGMHRARRHLTPAGWALRIVESESIFL